MKETTEFLEALTGTINSGFQAAADGKLGIEDLSYFFDDIGRWQAGVKDLRFAQEAASSTPAQVDAAFQKAAAQMNGVPEDTAYSISNALKGLYCIYRIAAKAGREAGYKAGLEQAKAR